MNRSEQARMLIGLTMPGSGPAAGAAAPPRVPCPSGQRWLAVKGTLTRARRWSREHSLDSFHTVYWLAMFACCSLFGLMVGGYVGFMENATSHAAPPHSFAQLAATDVGWAAKMRQDWLASHPRESAGRRGRETHWQRLIKSTATDSGLGGRPSPTTLGGPFVRLDAPVAGGAPSLPNHESE
ncbi:hypothetical protein FJY68_13115 [candidate division WOR-3 bacterium]|uniref:Uncharacterized protein n=1 Tax=candidate division WOR-3 bacterium TaxID=2052148 RepID=A0A938BRG4_UNCW3|nr:hypothetical protein [candidate division WOR-3 bacterium]MBM3332764.1 hypothetical protein [candidate division WOR-3 bacterium]